MSTLILTEKPSVAKDFSRALGVNNRRDGYYEGGRIRICWAVGHLVELFAPEDYAAELKRWSLSTLPILPRTFQYKPIPKTSKQLNVIKHLLHAPDLNRVVVATDAGREGEVIARTLLFHAGFTDKTRIFRFWTSQALTPSVIRETLDNLVPITDYDRLWRAGYYRQVADWMVGMNGTRVLTVRLGDLFSVGRVQTAVLALLVQRRRERENFTPEPYTVIHVQFSNDKGTWTGTWFSENETRIFDLARADALIKQLHQAETPGSVLSAEKKQRSEPPPYLFSLTDLQQEANKRYGFPAQKTLSIAQDLYQNKKCLSYPRTDARVLGTKNLDLVKRLVGSLSHQYPDLFGSIDPSRVSLANRRVFNDARLTDHHALIPLKALPSRATPDEQKLYALVLKRFAAAFHPNHIYEATTVITGYAGETFQTSGKTVVFPGWHRAWPVSGMEKDTGSLIPPLEKGDVAHFSTADSEKKKTTPPPPYTDALILKEMTNPGRYVSEKKMKDLFRGEVGIGTQSTRAHILEVLISRAYIRREGKRLTATDKGCYLVDILQQTAVSRVLTSAEETARWEMDLNKIAMGTSEDDTFLSRIRTFVNKAIQELKTLPLHTPAPVAEAVLIGRCPACKGAVRESARAYACACGFTVPKRIAGKAISPTMASRLIRVGRSGPYKGFISKKKKRFSAVLTLEETGGRYHVAFAFDTRSGDRPAETNSEKKRLPPYRLSSVPPCPACGGAIIEGNRGFGCANWPADKGGCRFVIWKELFGRRVTESQLAALLALKPTRPCRLTATGGTPVKARMQLVHTPAGWQVTAAAADPGETDFTPISCAHAREKR
ncbi:MAG: DNA topoisomerase III [Deltaproteobacteria bacterium]|nr:MAG: DNA topoisomerase III [Deltaproteobacteria bacterium]